MSEFEVMTQNVKRNAGDLQKYARLIDAYSDKVDSVRHDLRFNSEINRSVGNSLRAISDSLERSSMSIQMLSDGLLDVMELYNKTEQQIYGSEVKWTDASMDDASKGKGSRILDMIKGTIYDVIYEFLLKAIGPLGYLCHGILRGVEQKWGNVVSDLLKIAGGLIKNTEGSKIKWREWFKLDVSDKKPWEIALGKYFDFSSVKNGISSACNWIAELVKSGYNNYKEFKDKGISCRFFEETVVETVLKVGEGILITAAVAAVLSSPPGWVAVAVAVTGAATVVVDSFLDTVMCQKTSGSQTSWVEVVSDWICDRGEEGVKGLIDMFTGTKQVNSSGVSCGWGTVQMA